MIKKRTRFERGESVGLPKSIVQNSANPISVGILPIILLSAKREKKQQRKNINEI